MVYKEKRKSFKRKAFFVPAIIAIIKMLVPTLKKLSPEENSIDRCHQMWRVMIEFRNVLWKGILKETSCCVSHLNTKTATSWNFMIIEQRPKWLCLKSAFWYFMLKCKLYWVYPKWLLNSCLFEVWFDKTSFKLLKQIR